MLRIVVIGLFVANLLLLALQLGRPVETRQQPETTSQPVGPNIPTILLFSEMAADQDLLSSSRQCFTLGPFHAVENLQQVRDSLDNVSINQSERTTEASVDRGYWVYIPPYPSLLEANQVLFGLRAQGLDDSVVIFEGELKNGISLGYFLRHANAQRRVQGLRSRGYEPSISVRRQTEFRYWLDYEQVPGSSLVKLDTSNLPGEFLQRSLPCPEAVDPVEYTQDSEVQQEVPDSDADSIQDELAGDTQQSASEPPENIAPGGVST